MPDFERVTDSLREHLAETPEQKSYCRGYSKGKSKARWEILIIACFIYFSIAAIGHYYT